MATIFVSPLRMAHGRVPRAFGELSFATWSGHNCRKSSVSSGGRFIFRMMYWKSQATSFMEASQAAGLSHCSWLFQCCVKVTFVGVIAIQRRTSSRSHENRLNLSKPSLTRR